MLQKNFKQLTRIQPIFIRKFQFAKYRQIVDSNVILEQQKKEKEQNNPIIEKYDKIYKPQRTLEFLRKSDLVLYSAVPLKHINIIFKWPFIQLDCLTLFFLINYVQNWFNLSYQMITIPPVLFSIASFITRSFQFQNIQWQISKLSLLKGGKILIVERSTLDGKVYKDWINIKNIKLISKDLLQFVEEDEADFLDKEGQFNQNLKIQVKDYVFKGYSLEEQVITFNQHGTVHDPEILEAVLKGYHIDDSDFTINTNHKDRTFESLGNYQFNFIYQVSLGRFIVFIIKLLVPSNPSANLIQDQGKNKNQFLSLQKQTQNKAKFNRFKDIKSNKLQINEKIKPFFSNNNSQLVLNSSYVNFKNLKAYQSPQPTKTDINKIQYFYFSYLKESTKFQDMSSKFSLSLK